MVIILIAEDEPISLTQTVLLVSRLQIADVIVTASDGKTALDLYNELHEYIPVLISDNLMPGLNGIELIKECKIINPLLKTILISAYSKPEVDNQYDVYMAKKDLTPSLLSNTFIDFHLEKGSASLQLVDILNSLNLIKRTLHSI